MKQITALDKQIRTIHIIPFSARLRRALRNQVRNTESLNTIIWENKKKTKAAPIINNNKTTRLFASVIFTQPG